jgi:hypothetical protein
MVASFTGALSSIVQTVAPVTAMVRALDTVFIARRARSSRIFLTAGRS